MTATDTEEHTTRSGIGHFSVHGDYLTDLLRQFVLEGRYDPAIRIIVENMHPTSWDSAIAVLSGHQRFEGVNDLELVDEDPETRAEVEREQRSFYAGRVRIGEHWYRPYAWVHGYSSEDMPSYTRNRVRRLDLTEDSDLLKAIPEDRSAHYARSPDDMIAVLKLPDTVHGVDYLNSTAAVLFERVPAPPPWLAVPRREYVGTDRGTGRRGIDRAEAQVALDDFLASGRRLEEDGAAVRYWPRHREEAKREAERKAARAAEVPTDAAAEALRRRKLEEEREREEKEREAERLRQLTGYRKAIIAQADAQGEDAGWVTLKWSKPTPGFAQVPRGAFEHWALWRVGGEHLAAPWERVSPSGVKMAVDDRYHTDWMLGAILGPWDRSPVKGHGLLFAPWGIEDTGDEATLSGAAYRAAFELQDARLEFKVHVLHSRPGPVTAKVYHPKPGESVPAEGCIIVIPHLGVEYEVAALAMGTTGAIITERGGPLAHLAIVGQEVGLRIVREPGALQKYPSGRRVTVDTTAGAVILQPERRTLFDRLE